jgi:pimeloyl-ACP methyl ester carboxylesterase
MGGRAPSSNSSKS